MTNWDEIIVWQQSFICKNLLYSFILTSEELKTSGSKKFSSAQSSWRLFCSGVPVRRRRFVVWNSRTISDSYKWGMVEYQGSCTIQHSRMSNLWFLILDAVSFIDDHVPPVELLEGCLLSENHLIRGDHHVPLTRKNLLLDDPCLQPGCKCAWSLQYPTCTRNKLILFNHCLYNNYCSIA